MKQQEKVTRAVLFLALVIWMVLAGMLFLEAVATSLGVEGPPRSVSSAAGIGSNWRNLFLTYRYATSLISIFLGYHCFGRKEWARKGLITLIVLDLCVWVGFSASTFVQTGGFELGIAQMFLQVFVVLFEVGLLWLLLDDHIIRDFQQLRDRVFSPRP